MGLSEDGDSSGCGTGETQEGAAGDGRWAVGGHQEILQIWQRGMDLVNVAGAGENGDGALGIETARARPDESGWQHSTPVPARLQEVDLT